MNIYTELEKIPPIEQLVLTIGTFDGVHLGHQTLIRQINQKAKEKNGQSGLLTFHPHPRMILNSDKKNKIQLLSTIEERLSLLEKTGIDNVFVIPFSVDFANMDAEDYLNDILIHYFHPKHLVIGYDHRFGKNRAGDIHLLNQLNKKYNYTVEEVSRQKMNDITYSSTNIRNSLLKGQIQEAKHLLGYDYKLNGVVVHGEQIGRTMNFPTANIQVLNESKLIPATGVYAVKTTINEKKYCGMLNIGTRPTFNGLNKTIENHIFKFCEEIYGYSIQIEFIKRIRDEIKFNSLEDLKTQLHKDKKQITAFFNH